MVITHGRRAARRGARGRGPGAGWPARLAAVLALSALLGGASCSAGDAPGRAALDPAKVGSVVVGSSSRADVFAALGAPARTERSAAGETWIYESGGAGEAGGGQHLLGGVSAASGVAGAFVPYAGLLGSGLGLANAALGGARAKPEAASLTVAFGGDGVVRECVYASTASPIRAPGAAGAGDAGAAAVDCRRPAPGRPRAP